MRTLLQSVKFIQYNHVQFQSTEQASRGCTNLIKSPALGFWGLGAFLDHTHTQHKPRVIASCVVAVGDRGFASHVVPGPPHVSCHRRVRGLEVKESRGARQLVFFNLGNFITQMLTDR